MILRFYRSNQTVVQLALPLVVLILWPVHLFFPYSAQSLPDHSFFQWSPDWPLWAVRVLEGIVFLLEALLFNRLINDLELYDRVTHVPGVVYLTIAFMLVPEGEFRWITFSNLFLMQFLRFVLVTYRQPDAREEAFWAGMALGIAVCFSWTLFPLLLIGWIMMLVLKTFHWRENLLMALGMIFPLAVTQTIHFVRSGEIVRPEAVYSDFSAQWLWMGNDRASLIAWVLLLVLAFFGFWLMMGRMSKVVIRIRRQRQVMLYFFLSLLIVAVFSNGLFHGNAAVLLLLPLVFFTGYLLVHTTMVWLNDLLFYGLLLIFLLSRIFPGPSF